MLFTSKRDKGNSLQTESQEGSFPFRAVLQLDLPSASVFSLLSVHTEQRVKDPICNFRARGLRRSWSTKWQSRLSKKLNPGSSFHQLCDLSLISPSSCFLLCKMGIIISSSEHCCEDYMRLSEQSLMTVFINGQNNINDNKSGKAELLHVKDSF